MTLAEYKNEYPLTRISYHAADVEKIRSHAFRAGMPEKKGTRSDKQRKYQWGCVYETISKDTGYTPSEIHQLMQKQFLAYENKGEWFVRSTTSLNTKEMEIYLESVRRFAAMELNCFVPLPNEPDNFYYNLK